MRLRLDEGIVSGFEVSFAVRACDKSKSAYGTVQTFAFEMFEIFFVSWADLTADLGLSLIGRPLEPRLYWEGTATRSRRPCKAS